MFDHLRLLDLLYQCCPHMIGRGDAEADRPNILLLPGKAAQVVPHVAATPLPAAPPRISCIMASRGRIIPAKHAIDCFQRQTYPNRELIIATAATDGLLHAYIRTLHDPAIRLIEVAEHETPGRLRNAAIAESSGSLVAVWDDDDLNRPDRLELQFTAMSAACAVGSFLARVMLWWPAQQRLAASAPRIWENSMLVRRAALSPYREDGLPGEDTDLAAALRASHPLMLLDRPEAYCYVAHGTNISNAAHFAMLFNRASRHFAGDGYQPALDQLGATMPIRDYAADIAQ